MGVAAANTKQPGWVIKSISEAARISIYAYLIYFFIGLAGLFFARHMVYNYIFGPFPLQLKEYKSVVNRGFLHRYYFTVTGTGLKPTSIGQFSQSRHSKTKSDVADKYSTAQSYFYIFTDGPAQVMAKLDGGQTQNGWITDSPGPYTFTGLLNEIDDDELLRLMRTYESAAYQSTDKYLLDGKNPSALTFITWVLLSIFGFIAVMALFGVLQNCIYLFNPLGTKFGKGLRFYGNPQTVAAQIEADYQLGAQKWECLMLTNNWALDALIENPLGKKQGLQKLIVHAKKAEKNSNATVEYTLKFETGLEANFSSEKTGPNNITEVVTMCKSINAFVQVEYLNS